MFDDIAAGSVHDQIALSIERQAWSAGKGQSNGVWVGARRDDKVVFELALITIKGEVDALVNIGILDAAIIGDVLMPLAGVVAHEVVARVVLRIDAGRLDVGIGPLKLQLHLHEQALRQCRCRRRTHVVARTKYAESDVKNSGCSLGRWTNTVP